MHTLKRLQERGYHTPEQKQRLLHKVAQSKGRQQLFLKQHPETLDRLLDTAMIESVRTKAGHSN